MLHLSAIKKQPEKYGHLPTKEAEELPWSHINVDLIGAYVVRTPKATQTLCALTMIDPVTGWLEVIAIPDKNAHTVMEAFNNTWLTRYPQPQYKRYDNGAKFKALFKQMCNNYGMKEKPSYSYNPQSNGIAEQVHLVLGNALRTFELHQRRKILPLCQNMTFFPRMYDLFYCTNLNKKGSATVAWIIFPKVYFYK
jgi:hypothetical protein